MTALDSLALYPSNWSRALRAGVPHKAVRDLYYRLRYGQDAPLSDEPIYVDPSRITHQLRPRGDAAHQIRRSDSGRILAGDWDLASSPISAEIKHQSCRMRYIDGSDWRQTPIFDLFRRRVAEGAKVDGISSERDFLERYAALDRLFDETARRGYLSSRQDLPDRFRREHGGVLVSIGRDGQLLRSGGGYHRFAIAQILGLPEMPAQIGVIHPKAFTDGVLADLRVSRRGAMAAE